eukprot:scaffold2.g7076.t1
MAEAYGTQQQEEEARGGLGLGAASGAPLGDAAPTPSGAGGALGAGGLRAGDGEEDELDALLRQYEQQAAADAAAARQRGAAVAAQHQRAWQPAAKRQRTGSVAAERREAALSQPIAADNKGFQLLSAMGYQPGQGLGRSVQGRAEPLPLEVKQGRGGLGAVSKRAAAREQQRERTAAAAAAAAQRAAAAEAAAAAGAGSFQARTAAAAVARRLDGQLRRAQRACEALDTAAGVAASHMWGGEAASDAGAAAGAGTGGAGFPGGEGGGEEGGELQAAREAWEAQPPAERLGELLGYLRRRYAYCLFCGCRYEGREDMEGHCPGPGEDDHDV